MSRYADVKKVTAAALGANHHGHPEEARQMLKAEETGTLEETRDRLVEVVSQVIDELASRRNR